MTYFVGKQGENHRDLFYSTHSSVCYEDETELSWWNSMERAKKAENELIQRDGDSERRQEEAAKARLRVGT